MPIILFKVYKILILPEAKPKLFHFFYKRSDVPCQQILLSEEKEYASI